MKIQLYTPLDLNTLAAMAGGRLVLFGMSENVGVTHICTDSREADGNTLFCAIRGERVDGHDYIPKAASLGCSVFLCERLPDDLPSVAYAAILVPDTVEAMGWMAGARREGDLDVLPVVAVTGSVGKTTTKEMIYAVLASARRVFKKDGNYNSTIGLPLSFLEIAPDTEGAVLEMGMSSRGEIASMTSAVRPDVAVIANVGSSHLEHLGTRENIARAKLEIAQGLRPGGTLLINGDEPLLAALGQDFDHDRPVIPQGIRVLRLSLAGADGADYTACNVTPRDRGMGFDLATPEGIWRDLWIPAMGEHLVWAAAFAAAVGQIQGLDEGQVKTGLATYRPADMRQNTRTLGGVTIIEDCYNAAPESMRAALRVLALTPAARRVAVLGDMRELGDNTEALHRGVGAEAVRQGVDLLVAVGELGQHIAQGAMDAGLPAEAVRSITGPEDYPAAARWLLGELGAGDCILFKASRAMALEKMAEAVASAVAEGLQA
ncbi:MAG: UDP-N-acetylmuramoyl-tripeptide--D-alanyl-D-alanine ligase [Ruminococcaceae bacterium]|nr:UDP-N-acetylmuramoyl-tripeptide--D-alanyl-D-alanine ligase [Oscillospiraceae bacterium]